MKRIVIISLFILAYNSLQAQPPAPGSNVTNQYIDKLEGTWRWVNGSDTLTLRLKKINTQLGNYTEDVILGVHGYVKNGIVIEDSLNQYNNMIIEYKKSTLMIYQEDNSDTSKFIGSIQDLTKKKTNRLHLTYAPGIPPTILLQLEPAEGVHSDPNFQYGVTLPRLIILTKQ